MRMRSPNSTTRRRRRQTGAPAAAPAAPAAAGTRAPTCARIWAARGAPGGSRAAAVARGAGRGGRVEAGHGLLRGARVRRPVHAGGPSSPMSDCGVRALHAAPTPSLASPLLRSRSPHPLPPRAPHAPLCASRHCIRWARCTVAAAPTAARCNAACMALHLATQPLLLPCPALGAGVQEQVCQIRLCVCVDLRGEANESQPP